MLARVILSVVLVFISAGCTTGHKKQSAQPQPMEYEIASKTTKQESYSPDYGYDDTWPADSYEKTAKKSYSDPVIQLTPKQIQRALKSAGFYQGPIDGKIGPKTKEAIFKFQKAKGLKVDGIVGKRTLTALNKYVHR